MFRFINRKTTQANNIIPIQSDQGTFTIYGRNRIDFKYDGLTFSRQLGVSQKFTLLGNPDVHQSESGSYLDGIAKKYLTLEGGLAIENVMSELRSNSGIPASAVSAHAFNIASWRWYDNHVALLINMLRAYHLKVLDERGEFGAGHYPKYDDGHLAITVVPPTGALETDHFRWPFKRGEVLAPEWAHHTEAMPTIEVPYIDVRPLTSVEVNFVLMMMCKWSRQTNLAIDFDLPNLTDRFAYRHTAKVTEADEWLMNERPDAAFPVLSSKAMLSAIRKYVNHNRVYNHFETAAQILAQLMVKPLPNNAEGHAWLLHDPVVNIPKFGSVRGRYPFLLTGEASLVQATALEDWSAIMGKPEIVFTYAVDHAIAVNTGLYLRRIKKTGMGTRVDDSYEDGVFLSPETFMAAAVACATGEDAPLNGMSDVYVFYPQFVDLDTVTYIPAQVREAEGYNVTSEGLKVLGVPLACSPVLLYPMAAFDDANPYSGSFKIGKAERYVRGRAVYSPFEAWKLAWAARIAGYDTRVSIPGDNTGLSKLYADNADSWTHIPDSFLNPEAEFIYVTDLERRRRHFIDLPNMTNPSFARSIEVQITLNDMYVESTPGSRSRAMVLSRDYVAPIASGIQVISAADLRNYWGSVRRSNAGLSLVGFTMPAVIPTERSIAGQDLQEAIELEQEPSVE
ncbi:gag [Torulaspora delbrueckii virus LA]|uniref:Gag n=1 Tax=Torulaspora delbrueckii virus LA TaxID=2811342 RepID=A0A891ZXK0_9VIRU|nr:gag [Torulaspora delbrueckii virus LA]